MDLNYTSIFAFLVVLVVSLAGYYNYLLKAGEGEDKKIKMFKRVIIFIIIAGILHVYSITEDTDLKEFFIVVLAVIVNVYTVIHSTKQCNYPTMYKIRLCIYSAVITMALAGALWYSTNNSLFGFMINKKVEEKVKKVGATFSSKILTGITSDSRIEGCPDKTHEDYNTQMQNLHDSDLPKYNACLSQEVRDDLSKGI